MFGFFHTKITLEINVIEKPITGLMSQTSEIAQAVQRLMARVTGAFVTMVHPPHPAKSMWKIVSNKGPRVTGSLHVSPNDCCFFFQDSIYFDWTWTNFGRCFFYNFSFSKKTLPNKDCWAGIRHFVSDSIFRLVSGPYFLWEATPYIGLWNNPHITGSDILGNLVYFLNLQLKGTVMIL